MYENLICFERKQIELSSLVGSLEFLLSALQSVDEEWEKKILNEVTTLEVINAIEIIKNSGEEVSEIQREKKEELTKKAIFNLKTFIEKDL